MKKAIKIKPDNIDARLMLARIFQDSEKHDDAIEAYKELLKLNPDNSVAHINLSYCYIQVGQYEEAVRSAKDAITIQPHEVAFNNLGCAYRDLTRYGDAVEAFYQSIKINPDYPRSHYNLGLTYLRMTDRASAIREYEMLKGLDSELAQELSGMINKSTDGLVDN